MINQPDNSNSHQAEIDEEFLGIDNNFNGLSFQPTNNEVTSKEDFSWILNLPRLEKRGKRKGKKAIPEYREDTSNFSNAIEWNLLIGDNQQVSSEGSSVARQLITGMNPNSKFIETNDEGFNLDSVSTAFVIPIIVGEDGSEIYVMIEDLDKRSDDPTKVKLKFPGGGIEGTENKISGAYRELVEETDRNKVVRCVVKEKHLEVIGRMDLPSRTSGTHSIAIFTVNIQPFLREYLVFGEEQCGIFFVTADDIQEAIKTGQMLPQHTMAWNIYQNKKKS
jgi:ADP-ribose pyrophosphatase YjhB (NUDIX family)